MDEAEAQAPQKSSVSRFVDKMIGVLSLDLLVMCVCSTIKKLYKTLNKIIENCNKNSLFQVLPP